MTYCETVVQNAIGCTLGSLAAIGMSFLVYRLSSQATREESARNEREAYELYVLLVQKICNASEALVNDLQQFTQDLLQPSDDFPDLRYKPLNDFKRMSELHDLQKFLFSFTKLYPVKDNPVKDFSTILATTDYLQAQFTALPQQAEKGQYFFHQRQLQIKDLIEQSEHTLKNILAALPSTDPLVISFAPIVSQYALQRQQQSPLSFHVNLFLAPVNNVLVTIQNQGGLTNDLHYLKGLVSKALSIFNQIPQHNVILSDDIKNTLIDIRSASNELKKIADKM